MPLSPAITALMDAAAAKWRERQLETKGWRSDAERRRVMLELGFWVHDIDNLSLEGRKAMVRRMDNALRAELRSRERGDWNYSRSRHLNLLHAYRAETLAVQAMLAATRYLEAAE